jgi:hypothetical protein
MVNKDNIQEQILKDILLKMNYDSSKTLNENIQEQQFYIPQSDNTRIDPQYLGLMPDGKRIPPGLMLNYTGKNKPSSPSHQDIMYPSNISSYDRQMMMNKLDYFVTYTSPRLKRLCKDNKICSCSQYRTSCKGIKGKGLLMKVYKSDLEDWEERQPSAMAEFIHEYRHGLIDALAIATFFIPFVGPVISLGLEAGNAALYLSEGDDYQAGLAAAFALIPGGTVLKRIPGVKKFGEKFLIKTLSRARTLEQGRKLSKPLTKLEKEAIEAFSKNSDEIMKAAQAGAKKEGLKVGAEATAKTISKTLKNKISKLIKDNFSEVIYRVHKYAKKHPKKFNLATAGLQVGTLWYSWDKLAEIYGITDKSTNTQSSATEEKVVTITDHDETWDYKKDGDKYYTKKKDSDKWILTSGTSKEAIKTKIFGSGSKYGKTILTPEQKEIEDYIENNFEDIEKQIVSTVDTVAQNKVWDDIFSDI